MARLSMRGEYTPGAMDSLLSGKLYYVFLVSIIDAALLSLAALFWFRGSLEALMRRRASSVDFRETASPRSDAGVAEAQRSTRLMFALFDAGDDRSHAARAVGADPPVTRRIVIAYVAGAAAYSLVITTMQLGGAEPSYPWVAWLGRVWENMWPLVPAFAALLVLDRRALVRVVGAYLALGVTAVFLFTLVGQALRGSFNTAPFTNVYWLLASLGISVAIPLALILLTSWRRIRSVMPLALASTLAFGFALIFFKEGMLRLFDFPALRSSLLDASALTSVWTIYYGLFLLASLPVGFVAWRILRRLANRFDQKRFSDVQLLVDCWWAIVAADQTVTLSSKLGFGALYGGIVAFAAYRAVVALALRARESGAPGKRLLLLRVFGYQKRTESLFDQLAQAWRFHGPVQLIAGVDLASRTANPGDMLNLLGGRLDLQYVASPADVGARIARLDYERDPDGRFRVNGVYCHDDTWQPAVVALIGASDRVLMDVRSFSQDNRGCAFELEQLLTRLPTDAVVLIVGQATDLPLLGGMLERSWHEAQRSGRARGDARLALVRVEHDGAREVAMLMRHLLVGAGEPRRVVTAEQLAQPA